MFFYFVTEQSLNQFCSRKVITTKRRMKLLLWLHNRSTISFNLILSYARLYCFLKLLCCVSKKNSIPACFCCLLFFLALDYFSDVNVTKGQRGLKLHQNHRWMVTFSIISVWGFYCDKSINKARYLHWFFCHPKNNKL